MNRNNSIKALIAVFSLIIFLTPLPAASATAGVVLCQTGAAAVLEGGAVFLGHRIIDETLYGGVSPYNDCPNVNPAGYIIGFTLLASYPLMAATGTYVLGEKLDGPAENKAPTFLVTASAAYAQSFLLATAANAFANNETYGADVIKWAVIIDLGTKPLLTTYVYHKIKKPRAGPRESLLPTLKPYVAAATGSDGKAVPVYGVTLNF